ncbi:MAG TPA: tetratricopeptide repeat protein [Blastocatellia bacterium]|nr:tetratricopeptide repeat protein [Blastocatellia bacterium]
MSKPGSKIITLLLTALAALCGVRADGQTLPGQADSAARQPGKTWAIVVGVSKYARLPGGQQLQFADRDAALFAEALKKSAVGAENVKLLVGADATVQQIKSAIGSWLARSASEADTVYIFFSGHGIVEREFGESYLLAADSDARDPYGTAISVSEIGHALTRRVRAGRVFLIADAVRRDLFPESESGAAEQFVQSFNRLASMRDGLSALLASGPGEFSREGRAWGGHGVFTKQLLDALSGGADNDRDGAITAGEVFDFVSSRVAQETSNKQHPWQSEARLAQLVLSRTAVQPAAQPVAIAKKADDIAQAQKPQPPPAQTAREIQRADVKESAPASLAKAEPPPPKVETREAKPQPLADRRAESPKIEPPKAVESKPAESKPAESKPEPARPEPIKAQPQPAKSKPARTAAAPPETARVATTQPQPTGSANAGPGIASEKLPPPPTPAAVPPSMAAVNATPTAGQPAPPAASMPVNRPEAGPSPIVLQLEAAISSGNLIEPKSASAWELYQKLAQEQSGAAEAARLKPMLADALMKTSRSILAGDVRADNVADKVDDFRRAGQMLARARTLAPGAADVAALEKLSAAQALIALQFYDEAERALAQLAGTRHAAAENALGLIFQGKLDEFQAERAYRRAIEIDPNWAAPQYNLALLYKAKKSTDAFQLLESAARLDPTNAAILATLGDEYFGKEQWPQAADAYRKAVAAKPSDATLHTKLGHALYSQGLRDEANREYQKATQLRAKQP